MKTLFESNSGAEAFRGVGSGPAFVRDARKVGALIRLSDMPDVLRQAQRQLAEVLAIDALAKDVDTIALPERTLGGLAVQPVTDVELSQLLDTQPVTVSQAVEVPSAVMAGV